MPKYALAFANLFDNEIEIHFVEGASDREVVAEFLGGKGYQITADQTLNDLKNECFSGDSLIEVKELP